MGFFSLFTYTTQTQVTTSDGQATVDIIESTQTTSVLVNETPEHDAVDNGAKLENQILEDSGKKGVQKQRLNWQVLRRSNNKEDSSRSPPIKKKNVKVSRSTKRAQKSALAVRSLIIGPTTTAAPRLTRAQAQPEISKVKSQLIKPKTANKVIAQLRELPASGDLDHGNTQCRKGPIHAVCLEHTEVEEDALHFAKLTAMNTAAVRGPGGNTPFGVASASADKLSEVLNDIHVVDLLRAPDLGLGQPGDGKGLLAGALPTPGTVLNGAKKITPELMNLGYAAGQFFVPDHSEIYPPTDRMSVLTYWWGLEVVLPPPSLEYLSNAQSITGAIMNFLSALSLVNNGVREILPFVRYISQFIDFEFNSIKRQDRGQGVVCAATWIMPAAMVPRPWDFPAPPTEGQPEPSDHPGSTDSKKSKVIPTSPVATVPPVKRPSPPVSSPIDAISNQPVIQIPVA